MRLAWGVLWIVCALCAIFIAKGKNAGRSRLVLVGVLGPIGMIIAFILKTRPRNIVMAAGPMAFSLTLQPVRTLVERSADSLAFFAFAFSVVLTLAYGVLDDAFDAMEPSRSPAWFAGLKIAWRFVLFVFLGWAIMLGPASTQPVGEVSDLAEPGGRMRSPKEGTDGQTR